MYDIGIARKAHPLARLQARKRDFSVRMMSSTLPPADPSQPSSSQNGRSGLAERKPKTPARRENAENRNPTLASSRGQTQSRAAGNNRGAFEIYTEGEGEDSGGNAWTDLETRDAHRKENYRTAVPAQGEVLRQSTSEAPRTPRVEVYVDEVRLVPRTGASACCSLCTGRRSQDTGEAQQRRCSIYTVEQKARYRHSEARSSSKPHDAAATRFTEL